MEINKSIVGKESLHKNGIIIINFPGFNGDIDGYNNKYGQLADFVAEKGLGTVVRIGNPFINPYPDSMINNLENTIQYCIKNSAYLCGSQSPTIYLMGFSAGASSIASVCSKYKEIEKIILIAPSGDAGKENVENSLPHFTGDVAVVVGNDDEVVGVKSGQLFYELAVKAKNRKLCIVPDCDHQFKGKTNGIIMSKIPLWGFLDDTSFPQLIGGIELY